MFIKENSIKKAPDAISFNVHSIGDVFEPISFSLGNTIDHTKVLINTEYPFTAITFEHESIPRPLRLTATYLYTFFHKKITSSSPLEVLYIGQSFGKGGELSARDRLLKHPTLQKILSEYQVDKPAREIMVILMGFDHNLLFSCAPSSQATESGSECDDAHTGEIFSNLPEEAQIVNVVEAAMINYFKPPYNTKFTSEFPKPKDKSYRYYYDLDFNAISIEFQLEFPDISQNLVLSTSANSLSCDGGIIYYSLNNETERASMFDLFDD